MKKVKHQLMLLAIMLTTVTQIMAQVAVTVLPGNNSTSGNGRAPQGSRLFINGCHIITAAEMTASAFPGNTIAGIGFTWNVPSPPAAGAPAAQNIATTGSIKVYVQNTLDATYLKGTAMATILTGMTKIIDGTITIPAGSSQITVNVPSGGPGTSSFITTAGQGLYIAFEYQTTTTLATPLGAPTVFCNTAVGNNTSTFGGATNQSQAAYPTTLGLTVFRPEMRLLRPSLNDLSVANIYGLGTMAVGYNTNYAIRARIKNNGDFAFAPGQQVDLAITGASPFSTSLSTATTISPGGEEIVTFSSYSPAAIGNNTVTVSLPLVVDDISANNSSSYAMNTSKDISSYRYIAPVTGGVGFGTAPGNGVPGDFVGKFFAANNFGNPDTINGFEVIFTSTGQPYSVVVYDDDGAGGIPGTLLHVTSSQNSIQDTVFISLPDIEVSGGYYVGIRQLSTTNVGFGYQTENTVRSNTFYYAVPPGGPAWTDFSPGANFRITATVQYKTPQPPNCAVYVAPANTSLACQNGTSLTWGSGGGGPTGYRVYFGTNQALVEAEDPGTLVQNSAATSYATGPLSPSTIYYWRVTAYNVQGDASGCATLSRSFTTNLVSCYCASTATNGGFEYITNVQSGAFSNPSGSSLYSNNTGLGPINNVNIGSTFTVTVTQPAAQVYDEDRIYIYADFNHDGDWNDAGELCGNADVTILGGEVNVVTCTVPQGALPGNTLLRIKLGDEATPTIMTNDPCQVSFTYGEVEDYLLNITCGSTASSNFPLCQNGPINLSSTYLGSGTPVSYSWTTDALNGFTSLNQNPNVTNSAGVSNDGGNYTVTITDNNGCTSSATVTVNVSPSPDPQASSNAPICAGSSLSLSSINNNGFGGDTYSWTTTAANGFASSSQNPSVTGSAGPNDVGLYTVVITNGFGCSASASTSVTVNDNPNGTPAVTGVSCVGLCDGGVVITPTAGQAPYIFTDGVTVNTDGIFTNAFCEGPASVDMLDDNGCAATIPFSVGHINSAPPNVNVAFPTVPAYACNGNNLPANTSPVNLATTYTWDGPIGTTFNSSGNPYASTGTSVTVNYGPPNGSGYNICVQASNGCGATNRRCSFVRGTVNVPGVIAAANNRTTECASTSANYSIAAVGGATGYTWSITGDATVIGSGTSATVNFGAAWTGGNLCVTANTPCYSSPQRCLSLSNATVSPGAITGSSTACPGSSGTYSVPIASGASTYNWALPANSSGSSTSNSILVNFGAGFTFGDIRISITSICGVTSIQKSKTISNGLPASPSTISGNAAGLCGQTVTYSCPSVAGASTYTWSAPSGTINSGQNSTSINVTYGSFTNGNVCVVANNACGSSAPRCIPVKGSPTISGSITFAPNPFCANESGVDFQVSPAFGSSSYNWNFPSGVIVVNDLGNEQVVNWGANSGIVSVTAANSCGNTTKSITITLGCREEGQVENVSFTGDVNVFPNPAHDQINVVFSSPDKGNYSLRVIDFSGRVLSTTDMVAQKGVNNQLIDLSRIAKGAYLIDLKSEQFNRQIRIVVE